MGDSEMGGPGDCSSQPQFLTSVGRGNRSNGPGTPLIESIDVDQIIIPEVWLLDFGKMNKISVPQLTFKFSCESLL